MRMLRAVGRWFGRALLALLLVALCAWSVLAIYYSNLPGRWLRGLVAATFAFGAAGAFAFLPRRGRTALWFTGAVGLVFVWWSLIPASNDRDWRPELAVLPHATFAGDRVTVHNVRHSEYRTKDEFTLRHEDRTYDLRELDSSWLVLSYWSGTDSAIAHTMVSFGFGPDDFLCFSVEARKEVGEEYSALRGAFKQLELVYVVADERDLLGVRASHREEELFLYPSTLPTAQARELFVELLRGATRLAERPAYYNTVTRNCTMTLIDHLEAVSPDPLPFHPWMVLSGFSDELAYERKRIPTDVPFDELRRTHDVTAIARALDGDPAFSRKLREHLPRR
jgi:hypothetical protein